MKSRILFLFVIFLICVNCPVKAQEKVKLLNTDSLLHAYDALPDDTGKIGKWNSLALYFNQKGIYDAALSIGNKTLALSKELNYKKGIINAGNNIGIAYMYKGNYPQALSNYLESARLLKEAGNKHEEAVLTNNIAGIYYAIQDTLHAMEKYRETFKIASQTKDKEVMAMATLGMGNIFYAYNKDVQTLYYYKKSLFYAREAGLHNRVADALINIGNLYGTLGSQDSAYAYFVKALRIREQISDLKGIAHCQENLGILCLDMGRKAECETWLKKSIVSGRKIGALDIVKEAEADLNELYEGTGNYKLALEHYKNMILVNDSLFNEANTKKLVKTEMQFEFDKKEASAKLEQEKKEAVAAAESKKQNIIIWSVCGILLLVIAFAIFAYRSYLQKQKANEAIIKQKEIIEEKQKEILDSIYYARRIQRCLITSEKYIANRLARLMSKN